MMRKYGDSIPIPHMLREAYHTPPLDTGFFLYLFSSMTRIVVPGLAPARLTNQRASPCFGFALRCSSICLSRMRAASRKDCAMPERYCG